MKQIIAKIIYKVTIITLVFGFLIQTISMFPFYVFASNEETLNEIEINSVNNVDESDVRLLYEVEDMKDEYLKVFRRTDGKLEYAYYDEMVNYFDGEKYVEVDASYKEESNEYSQSVNKYSVKLPKKIQENKKIKLLFDNSSSLEITYNDISKQEGKIVESETTTSKINELKNITGSVLYNNIFDNVDLLIESSATKFKENIILNEYQSNFSFSYNIKLKSLSLLKEDNIYKFINEEGTVVYEISPYFMWDSNMTYSEDISLVVEEVKKDEYKFTVTPSNEYLSKATYPVTIDPVVSYNASSSSDSVIKIKTIQKGLNNCSVNSYLQLTKYINEVDGVTENLGYYGIMEVDLTDIPTLDDIDYAFLRLNGGDEHYTEKAVVSRITSHSYSNINGNTIYTKVAPSVEMENAGNNNYTIDFTNFYNINKNTLCVYEISPELFAANEIIEIFGNHLSTSLNVPILNLVSYDYDGISSDRTYESVSAGDAGVVYIDNSLGISNLAIPLFSSNYLSLSHYYSQSVDYTTLFGNKMNINLFEKISIINETILCYTNGTGYNEYFYLDEETNKYFSEDGNSSIIEKVGSNYIYTFDSIRKEFNPNGVLVKTTLNHDNPDEKLIKEINYVINNNKISEVYTEDLKLLFNYETVNSIELLDFVTVQKKVDDYFVDYIKIEYEYDTNCNLVNIKKYQGSINAMEGAIFEIGKMSQLTAVERNNLLKETLQEYLQFQVYYEYDDSNQLVKAYSSKLYDSFEDNIDAYSEIALNYDNNKVSSYSYKLENDSTLKQVMTFNYSDNKTVVTDYTGYSRTYLFDYFNHTINISDSNGYITAYTYANFADELSQMRPKYYLKNQIDHISEPMNASVSPILNGGFENVTETGDVCMWNENSSTLLSSDYLTQDSAFGIFALKVGRGLSSSITSAYQRIYLPAGSYNISAIVKIGTIRNKNNIEGYINVEGENVGSVTSDELVFSNTTYDFIQTTFTVKSPTYVKIICGVRHKNNSLLLSADSAYFDNIGIGNGNIYSNYNIIENSSFEVNKTVTGDSTVDTRWSCNRAYIYERNSLSSLFGQSELKLIFDGTASQTINYNAKPGDLFNLSAFARYEEPTGDVKVKVRFYDSNSSYTTDYYTLKFTNGPKTEQYSIGNIEVGRPDGLEDSIEVEYNRIQIVIINEVFNPVYVDNVCLVPFSNGKNYEYNENSKVTKIKEGDKVTEISYQDDKYSIGNITTTNSTLSVNESYLNDISVKEYVLDSVEEEVNNITSLKVANFEKEDDESGSIYTSYIDKNGYGYTTSAIYDEYYQYQLSYTDEFGNTTTYEYDYYTGNMTKATTNYYNNIINQDTLLNYIYSYDKYGYLSSFSMTNTQLNPDYDETISEGTNNQKEIELDSRIINYEYDSNGNITKVTINGDSSKVYYFEYDEFNMLIKVSLNNVLIKQYEYLIINGINTGIITKEINEDESWYEYNYDNNYNLTSYSYNYITNEITTSIPYATYKYDELSKLVYYKEHLENKIYYYEYNQNNSLCKIKIIKDNSFSEDYISFEYDDKNRVTSVNKYFSGTLQTITYSYNGDELSYLKINDSIFTKPEEVIENEQKLLTSYIKYIENGNEHEIIQENNYYEESNEYLFVNDENTEYSQSNNSISSRIDKQEFIINNITYTYEYTYDNIGNITSINYTDSSNNSNNKKYSYTYYLGQLLNETVEKNNVMIYNCTYNYDSFGNMLSIERSTRLDVYASLPAQQSFVYNSYNELTEYTIDNTTYQVSYNNGNPLTYKDYTLTFNNGNLTSLTNTNDNIIYEYNADGIRIKKVVNGVTTSYTVFNGLIIEEAKEGTAGYTIKYLYDDNNLLVGFIYNNETYYYIRTLTGEITKIVNSAKEVVGEYYYDAYGNILNISSLSSIAQINPYRYKGYYYDQETNLYYCRSRYYSPEIYRWVSRDEIEYLDPSSITGCNLYVYCHNNPVMYMDENGNIAGWSIAIIGFIIGFIIGTVVSVENQVPSGEELIKEDEVIMSSKNGIDYVIDPDGLEVHAKWEKDEESWKIYNSYLINNENDMYKICTALYNEHPVPIAKNSTEYRTIDDMVYEWQEHNKGYLYSKRLPDGELKNMGVEATMHVDINPGDQGKSVYQLMWERIF